MEQRQLLTIKETADYLNIKPATLMYWIENGKIACPYYKLNGKKSYRFKFEDVEKFLEPANEEVFYAHDNSKN